MQQRVVFKETDIQIGDILVHDGMPSWEIVRWDSGVNTIKNLNIDETTSGTYGNILDALNYNPQHYTLIKSKSSNFNSLYEKLNGQ